MVANRPRGASEKLVTIPGFHPSWLLMKRIGFGLLLGLMMSTAHATSATAAVTNAVEIQRFTWPDAKRNRDVPVKIYFPAATNGPFPIILFSHGLGGSREGYEYLGWHWAAHGYVSVHLQHAGSDQTVWNGLAASDRMAAMRKAAANPRNAINRPLDVSLALDELERLKRENAAWQRRLDLERVGVAGHSFGAYTTLAAAGQAFQPGLSRETTLADSRVKAAIPMSAPAPANKLRLDEVYARISIPCLHMTGTRDASPIGDTKPEERRLPFDHCRNSDQFLITFTDGDHMIFSGRPRRMGGGEQDARFHELICESSTLFWDAYLRDDMEAKARLLKEFPDALGPAGKFEVKLLKR